MFGKLILSSAALLLLCAAVVLPGWSQTPQGNSAPTPPPSTPTVKPAPARPAGTPSARDEGKLIELEDMLIKGEIAQPNVAITVSRADPQFREITLQHTPTEGLNDLDLSGLRTQIPPAARIHNWDELLKRPRQ